MLAAGTAFDAVRHGTTKEELALRKKNEPANTTRLLVKGPTAPPWDPSQGLCLGSYG